MREPLRDLSSAVLRLPLDLVTKFWDRLTTQSRSLSVERGDVALNHIHLRGEVTFPSGPLRLDLRLLPLDQALDTGDPVLEPSPVTLVPRFNKGGAAKRRRLSKQCFSAKMCMPQSLYY